MGACGSCAHVVDQVVQLAAQGSESFGRKARGAFDGALDGGCGRLEFDADRRQLD